MTATSIDWTARAVALCREALEVGEPALVIQARVDGRYALIGPEVDSSEAAELLRAAADALSR